MKTLQAYVAPVSGKNPASLNITRKDLNIPGARCWVLDNFLSRFECEHYIDAAEKLGYESIESEYPKGYRDCVRVGS
ncbi:hypothetical protein BC937DRAFT_89693 [Endogone sp. FLAS-F59071]|nr:hypothetical protein BC937DRAFT_89693 [Endogone sp. FLAS-F59071]|eukprot:RUS17637.1 hypothetical protein BC937DRAFT_89693 [Endogone sp. FLAS-F59071]